MIQFFYLGFCSIVNNYDKTLFVDIPDGQFFFIRKRAEIRTINNNMVEFAIEGESHIKSRFYMVCRILPVFT